MPRLLPIILVLLLAGCGFHLRGAVVLPEVMARTHLTAPPEMPLAYELKSLLLAAGAILVETPQEASARVTLHREKVGRRTLSLSGTGVAGEYELELEAEFSMVDEQGRKIADAEKARVRRAITVDPNDILGKSSEEVQLTEEMRRELARQILRRLRALSLNAATPADTPPASAPPAQPGETPEPGAVPPAAQ